MIVLIYQSSTYLPHIHSNVPRLRPRSPGPGRFPSSQLAEIPDPVTSDIQGTSHLFNFQIFETAWIPRVQMLNMHIWTTYCQPWNI